MRLITLLLLSMACTSPGIADRTSITVDSLSALADAARGDNRDIRMQPGSYSVSEYLSPEVLSTIRAGVDRTQKRPPVPMFTFEGSHNHIDLSGVTIEIDNSLYKKLPGGGYIRCLIVRGSGNTLTGLTIRHVGVNEGSGGNTLSLEGDNTTLEDTTLYVYGSYPYGYGDLLGKGGPNLVSIKKQSGLQVLGSGSIVRRTRVFSRAFGHCFYIQQGGDILLEDCYAEGAVRATDDMLHETDGPAFKLGFKSVYANRDGRYVFNPGYVKSLSEDGFRTYGNAGRVTLRNCTAIDTRAGFEIGAPDDAPQKTLLDNCVARGCERGFLIGSQTIVRRSSGDIKHGPLLYLRGGRDSDVELELVGDGPVSVVHALATIAGENHRVYLSAQLGAPSLRALSIYVGFGMPQHAEMSSPILPAVTKNVTLENTIASAIVITSDLSEAPRIQTTGRSFSDAELKASPGSWGLPSNGIATGSAK